MQRIKLVLFPSFIGDLLENKAITADKLMDVENISAIVSDYSVVKLLHLNSDVAPCKAIELLGLNTLKSYVSNNNYGEGYECALPIYSVGNTLNALSAVGDEEMTPVLYKNLHNYALGFSSIRIAPKTYAIVFKSLEEVSSTLERHDTNINDMEALIANISFELTDKELLEEDLYRNFLSLM